MLRRHDSVIPLIDLYAAFQIKREAPLDYDNTIMVTVETEEGNFAIVVDEIIGTQQVVVKNLDVGRIDPNVFSGCAVMGNGEIAVVLDVEALAAEGIRATAEHKVAQGEPNRETQVSTSEAEAPPVQRSNPPA